MLRHFVCLLLVAWCSPVLLADLVFTVSPSSTTAVQGQILTFNIHIHLTPTTLVRGTPPISVTSSSLEFDAFDLQARAGAGDSSGGVFANNGISHLLNKAPPSPVLDMQGNKTGLVFSVVRFSGIPGDPFRFGMPIDENPVLLATLFLETNGVAPGTYNFTLEELRGNSNSFIASGDNGFASEVPTFTLATGNTITYTITAVPEPSSIICFGCLAAFGVGYFIRRNRKAGLVS
jgi:hypothetical protein